MHWIPGLQDLVPTVKFIFGHRQRHFRLQSSQLASVVPNLSGFFGTLGNLAAILPRHFPFCSVYALVRACWSLWALSSREVGRIQLGLQGLQLGLLTKRMMPVTYCVTVDKLTVNSLTGSFLQILWREYQTSTIVLEAQDWGKLYQDRARKDQIGPRHTLHATEIWNWFHLMVLSTPPHEGKTTGVWGSPHDEIREFIKSRSLIFFWTFFLFLG